MTRDHFQCQQALAAISKEDDEPLLKMEHFVCGNFCSWFRLTLDSKDFSVPWRQGKMGYGVDVIF